MMMIIKVLGDNDNEIDDDDSDANDIDDNDEQHAIIVWSESYQL